MGKEQGLETFPVKSQAVNILGFAVADSLFHLLFKLKFKIYESIQSYTWESI